MGRPKRVEPNPNKRQQFSALLSPMVRELLHLISEENHFKSNGLTLDHLILTHPSYTHLHAKAKKRAS